MTFTNIKKAIAAYLGYDDSSGAILTGKNISETDLGNWVNRRYVDDLFATLSAQYPEDFEMVATAPFYKATGTVAAGSTSSTLVASTAIFANSMVGDTVYNSTDDETRTITGYTNTTTVTVDSDIDDDWDTDTIYVFGHEFALGGNATDVRSIRRVEVKYKSTDDYYTVAEYFDQNELFKTGQEVFYETSPVWYLTTGKISSVQTTVIGILPEPSNVVTDGIRIRYVEAPAELSSDSDVPRLPVGMHNLLIIGGAADALRRLGEYDKAMQEEQRYQMEKDRAIQTYPLTRNGKALRVRPQGRHIYRFLDRTN